MKSAKSKMLIIGSGIVVVLLAVLIIMMAIVPASEIPDDIKNNFGKSLSFRFNYAIAGFSSTVGEPSKTALNNLAALGMNGCIYPVFYKSPENADYNYLDDYNGKIAFTDEQLTKIKSIIQAKIGAYEKLGITYKLVVIPNKQSVYPENMPETAGTKGITRLEQVEAYLSKYLTSFKIVNPVKLLAENKNTVPLYDNTTESINAFGMYYVYKQLLDSTEEISTKLAYMNVTGSMFQVTEEVGGELAVLLEKQEEIKNNSVILDESFYTVNYKTDMVKENQKYTKLTDMEGIMRRETAKIFIQSNDINALELMEKYLSNTFYEVGYKYDRAFEDLTVFEYEPDAFIEVITEDELYTFLYEFMENYDSFGKDSADQSQKPVYWAHGSTVPKYGDGAGDCIMVMGIAEPGAVLKVTGENIDAFEVPVELERFIIPIYPKEKIPFKITMTATMKGRKESRPIVIDLTFDKSNAANALIIGDNHHTINTLNYEDSLGRNLFSDTYLEAMQKNLETMLTKVREASGKDTKLIFLLVESPSNALPDTIPDWMDALKVSDDSRLKQVMKKLGGRDDIVLLDTSETFNKLIAAGEKYMYFHTDSHWSEYAAYHANTLLMEYISKDFPSAKPRPITDYDVFLETVPMGDIKDMFKKGIFNYSVCTETTKYVRPNFTPRVKGIVPKPIEIGFAYYNNAVTTYVEDETLPSAYILRDSMSGNILNMMSEYFSKANWQKHWDYKIDYTYIKNNKPDYLIYIFVERNVDQLALMKP